MSAGSIPLPKRISDAQFVGDLFGLFKRHRIDTGEAGSFAQFESLLATKDAFRSQLFTLCTAISHMAEADLSGEQLLDLVARALGDSETAGGVPASAREAFLSGYEAWSNRGMEEPEVWPPVRNAPASNGPIPFPQPADDPLEAGVPATRTHGIRTVQEALLMARTETPFELPERGAAATARVNGVNVEGLTISELTKLLEDIERQMSRIKPAVHQLNGLFVPGAEPLERPGKARENGDSAGFRAAASAGPLRPSLVSPGSFSPTTIDTFLDYESKVSDPKDDKFLARHAYLNPGRRLPPNTPVPATRFLVMPAVSAAPPVVVLAPAAAAAVAAVVADAVPAAVEAGAPAAGEGVARAVVEDELPESAVIVDQSERFPIAVAYKSERMRLYFHLAVGVFAAFLLVGCPLAGMVLYQSLHAVRHYEYHDLKPVVDPAQTAVDASNPSATAAGPGSGLPVGSGLGSALPVGGPVAVRTSAVGIHTQTGHVVKGAHPPTRKPPVAVWPPPPQ